MDSFRKMLIAWLKIASMLAILFIQFYDIEAITTTVYTVGIQGVRFVIIFNWTPPPFYFRCHVPGAFKYKSFPNNRLLALKI